jgi:hypothetical protein
MTQRLENIDNGNAGSGIETVVDACKKEADLHIHMHTFSGKKVRSRILVNRGTSAILLSSVSSSVLSNFSPRGR